MDSTNESGKRQFYEFLKKLRPGIYTIKIIPGKKPASKGQKGYYFGVLLEEISLYTGYSTDDLHSMFGELYLTIDFEFGGKMETRVRSLTELSTKEAMDYFEKIRQLVLDRYGLRLPLPNEAGI